MGLFDNANFDDPKTMGLLAAAAQMFNASAPSTKPTSFGQVLGGGLMGGLNAYQGAQKQQQEYAMKQEQMRQLAEDRIATNGYRNMQMAQIKQKNDAGLAQQAAIERVKAKLDENPAYELTTADKFAIGGDDPLKHLAGKNKNFGLHPMLDINPKTGKPGRYVQDNDGNTKWLDVEVLGDNKFVKGDAYTPNSSFNKVSNTLTPIAQGSASLPPLQANAAEGLPPLPSFQSGASSPHAQIPMMGDSRPQVDLNAPWSKIVSPKEQDAVKGRVYIADSKRLDDAREEIRRGRSIMADLERFGELNRKTATGGLFDRAIPYYTDTDKREMEAIQNRLGPAQRVVGSGASSDRDVKLFLSGIPSVTQDGQVNKNIRDQFANQLQAVQDELAFKEKYLAEKGYLNGAEEAFAASKKSPNKSGKSAQPLQSDDLDITKLSNEERAYLQKLSPEAYADSEAKLAAKNQAQPTPQEYKTTSKVKMMSTQQKQAIDVILQSGDQKMIDNLKAKGLIQ